MNKPHPPTQRSNGPLKLPALQRGPSHGCVWCGGPATAYCARCGLTPYCSEGCQRRDWLRRHSAVCHNLAKLAANDAPDTVEPDLSIPAPAPLRRPHSPARREKQGRHDNERVQESQHYNKNVPGASQGANPGVANRRPPPKHTEGRRMPFKHDAKQDESPKPSVKPTGTPKPSVKPVDTPKPSVKPVDTVKPSFQSVDTIQSEATTSESKPRFLRSRPSTTQAREDREEPDKLEKKAEPPSVADFTPRKKMVPKNYLVETLNIGDTCLLFVDQKSADCKTNTPSFVCLSMHESREGDYTKLCEEYVVDCDADNADYKPTPGAAFSYFDPSDGAWYRARCLNTTAAALLDGPRVVSLTGARCRRLTDKYDAIPEFCCLLQAEGVQLGSHLKCTLVSKTANGFKVTLVGDDTTMEGEVSRWLPEVEVPRPAPPAPPASAAPAAPAAVEHNTAPATPAAPVEVEVPRPPLTNGATVLLVDGASFERFVVKETANARRFDMVVQDVLVHGRNATPLKEPAQKGQVVIAKYKDGLHYRAVCKRVTKDKKKFLLEYIDYGNIEISELDNLYPCPSEYDLNSQPAASSVLKLPVKSKTITPPGLAYVEDIRDTDTELILSLPGGAKTAPSGSVASLTVSKNSERVEAALDNMCLPDWKKLEESGGDVLGTRAIMYSELEFIELPSEGCELDITDVSMLMEGTVCGYPNNSPHKTRILTTLTQEIAEYCESAIGNKPYLPKVEELCVAKCPPYPQWFRAVMCEQVGGPGGSKAKLCFVDYGNLDEVPVDHIRKMMPDFVKGLPALGPNLEIRDFPKKPSVEQLTRAVLHMQMNEEGRGHLKVTKCQRIERDLYMVDAPALIAALEL